VSDTSAEVHHLKMLLAQSCPLRDYDRVLERAKAAEAMARDLAEDLSDAEAQFGHDGVWRKHKYGASLVRFRAFIADGAS
jgi:hypothetical protein